MAHDLMGMHSKLMMSPMFSAPFTINNQNLEKASSLFNLERPNPSAGAANPTVTSCPLPGDDVTKKHCDDGPASSNVAGSTNSSFEKADNSFSEEGTKEEPQDQVKPLSIKPEPQSLKKRKSSGDTCHGNGPALTNYTEMIPDQYKLMLPWLMSQWSGSGQNVNDFWSRFQLQKDGKDQNNNGGDKSEKNKEEKSNDDVKELTKANVAKNDESLDRTSCNDVRSFKRSYSLPSKVADHEVVVSESYSDPGKQSPSSDNHGNFFKENSEKNDGRVQSESSKSVKVSQSSTIMFPTNQSPSPDSGKAHGGESGVCCGSDSSELSLSHDGVLSKEKGTALPGGEIHSGVWIPTRSRNCHLCGKEFKNVYRYI